MHEPWEKAGRTSQEPSGLRVAWIAWIGLGTLALLVGLLGLLDPWIQDRVRRGGELAVSSVLWNALDFLILIAFLAPYLACVLFSAAAWSTWRAVAHRRRVPASRFRRVGLLAGAIVPTLAAAGLAVGLLIPALPSVDLSAMCQTATFESAVSPNGRYRASVVQVDCGAATGFNRQVVLARLPFGPSTSILYFREQPRLHLAWSGRTVTITGERSTADMDNPPPDSMIWAGVLARYVGPRLHGSL